MALRTVSSQTPHVGSLPPSGKQQPADKVSDAFANTKAASAGGVPATLTGRCTWKTISSSLKELWNKIVNLGRSNESMSEFERHCHRVKESYKGFTQNQTLDNFAKLKRAYEDVLATAKESEHDHINEVLNKQCTGGKGSVGTVILNYLAKMEFSKGRGLTKVITLPGRTLLDCINAAYNKGYRGQLEKQDQEGLDNVLCKTQELNHQGLRAVLAPDRAALFLSYARALVDLNVSLRDLHVTQNGAHPEDKAQQGSASLSDQIKNVLQTIAFKPAGKQRRLAAHLEQFYN